VCCSVCCSVGLQAAMTHYKVHAFQAAVTVRPRRRQPRSFRLRSAQHAVKILGIYRRCKSLWNNIIICTAGKFQGFSVQIIVYQHNDFWRCKLLCTNILICTAGGRQHSDLQHSDLHRRCRYIKIMLQIIMLVHNDFCTRECTTLHLIRKLILCHGIFFASNSPSDRVD